MPRRQLEVILLDIEGTTTDVDFVHRVLFPHSSEHLAKWVVEHADDEQVLQCIDQVRLVEKADGSPSLSDADVGDVLRRWIAEDRKHPALKRLQGFVWRAGYESGAFRGHLYPEVPGCLRAWRDAGLKLAIYSSGSIEAQQLLFRHSTAGDLTPLLSHHFDATIGPKRESLSYARIARELRAAPERILFLSDVEAELDAAQASGFETVQLVRPGTRPGTMHPRSSDFTEVEREFGLIGPAGGARENP